MNKEKDSVNNLIKDALLELMLTKSYMDITVTDVVNKANVARVSFYRNFNSISDVLDYFIDDINKGFIDDILPVLLTNDERKWREFLFLYLYKLVSTHKKISSMNLANISIIISKFDNKIQVLEKKMLDYKTINEKYKIAGKFGLINSIAKKWLNNGQKETPEELINCIMSIISKF